MGSPQYRDRRCRRARRSLRRQALLGDVPLHPDVATRGRALANHRRRRHRFFVVDAFFCGRPQRASGRNTTGITITRGRSSSVLGKRTWPTRSTAHCASVLSTLPSALAATLRTLPFRASLTESVRAPERSGEAARATRWHHASSFFADSIGRRIASVSPVAEAAAAGGGGGSDVEVRRARSSTRSGMAQPSGGVASARRAVSHDSSMPAASRRFRWLA